MEKEKMEVLRKMLHQIEDLKLRKEFGKHFEEFICLYDEHKRLSHENVILRNKLASAEQTIECFDMTEEPQEYIPLRYVN